MSEPLFTPAPFLLVRSPIWPVEMLKILEGENWVELLLQLYEKNAEFREAIAVASPSLYQSLQKKTLKDPLQAAQSLLNYAIRMATRATPFGLFSFVARGEWGEETKISCDSEVYKRARPDMEWVYSLIQKVYGDENLFPFLPIRKNPLIQIRGGRLFLNYRREEKGKISKNPSIRVNRLIQLILQETEQPVVISDLLDKLLSGIPTLDRKKTEKIIQDLLNHQFLLPGLLPSLLDNDSVSFEKLLENVPSLKDLKGISKGIEQYNHTSKGRGEEEFVELQALTEKLAKTKTNLQVDAAYPEKLLTLPKTIRDELTKTAEFLWKISANKSQFTELSAYHSQFIEKYGVNRTVPLLELLDEEKGLGSFLNKKQEDAPFVGEKTKKWDQWLLRTWQESLYQQKYEIVLHDALYEEVVGREEPFDKQTIPFSFDLFFKIIAQSPEEIEAGDYSLLSTQTSWQGGSTFGRFVDLLGPKMIDQLKEFYQQEEELDKKAYFAELSYFPNTVRSANVAIQSCLRRYRLDLESLSNETGTIGLKDIYVGAVHDRFYLTLKEGQVEIHSCIGNMLNITAAPLPLRFIQEVTLAKHRPVYPFSWGSLTEVAAFLPRVSYGRTIISPAKWNLYGADYRDKPHGKVTADFKAWAARWSLPRHVLLADADQHLLVDREHSSHVQEITRRLKRGESLQFLEHLNDAWMKRGDGHYAPEIVLPFTKNKQLAQESSITPLAYSPVSLDRRLKLIGSDWLFFKLYMEDESHDRFLLQQLSPFAEQLKKEGNIQEWFFIRYSDPEPHLRIRFRLPMVNTAPTLSLLQEQALFWLREGFIKNISFGTYEREIERYGGLELIEEAEGIFCADSLAALHLLQFYKKELGQSEAVFYALSVIHFLSDLGLNQDEILLFLDRPFDQSELKGFREHRQKMLQLISTLIENEQFKSVSLMRKSAVEAFRKKTNNLPPFILESVYSSLLHMHCNRLGCKGSNETKALMFAKHALQQVKAKNQHLDYAIV